MIQALRKVLKRMHYPLEVMLVCVRWYAAYPLSLRHIEEMMQERGVPEKITIDKSGTNTAAIEGIRADSAADIGLRQSKYLNNIVEQDHRAIKWIVRPMPGFKAFRCARINLAGVEVMHMIKKGAARLPQSPSLVRSQPVLLSGFLRGG